jgi:4-hydroxythreonine-4-phosphate dehydrogenase
MRARGLSNRPALAVTPGEPSGIGPDIIVSIAESEVAGSIVVYADAEVLSARAERIGSGVEIRAVGEAVPSGESGILHVLHVATAAPVRCGQPDPVNAAYVLETLDRATSACVTGELDGLVTGPVQKSVINDAGIPFTGHTEYLAGRTNAPTPVMLLVAGTLRVALATTHLPLSKVPEAITMDRLHEVLGVLATDLARRFGIEQPRILVCGLNPHAGEGGHLGHEDIEIIAPAVTQAVARGIDAIGPIPADTVFTPRRLQDAHAVLAMYHDQGLPVLKYAGFGDAVNVTLGLPIIRTSVDHGTALDIAGSGDADSGSLRSAIQQAMIMADRSIA